MSPHRILVLVLVITALGGCAPATAGLDLEGRSVDPLAETAETGDAATVLLFLQSDCPISNRFAPEVNRLHELFSPRHVSFWLVYPDPTETPDSIREHMDEYDYKCLAIRDPNHALVRRAGATISPEAAVFGPDGRMVYRGRINDRFVEWGRTRIAPTRHDLADAIEGVLEETSGELVTTPAVGCYLVDLR